MTQKSSGYVHNYTHRTARYEHHRNTHLHLFGLSCPLVIRTTPLGSPPTSVCTGEYNTKCIKDDLCLSVTTHRHTDTRTHIHTDTDTDTHTHTHTETHTPLTLLSKACALLRVGSECRRDTSLLSPSSLATAAGRGFILLTQGIYIGQHTMNTTETHTYVCLD